MRIKLKNKGLTLIELVIVIGILGILAVAALVALNPLAQFQKADDVRRKSDLAQIQRALESFYQDYGSYPQNTSDYLITYIDKTQNSPASVTVQWGSSWQPYMNVFPKDPSSSNHYAYYSPDGQSYYLYAILDRVNTSDQCQAKSPVPCGDPICGTGGCNYGVSSPNVTP